MVIVKRLNHRLGPRPNMGEQRLLRAEHCRARFLHNAGEGGVGRSRHSSLQAPTVTRLQNRGSR